MQNYNLKKTSTDKKSIQHLKGNWIVAEIKVSYTAPIAEHVVINSSIHAYNLIIQLWDKEKILLQEQFAALFFNQNKKMIGWQVLSTGTMTKCIVDIKLLASLALHTMATQVIIAHNHPSGNLTASNCDKNLAGTVKEALKLIDVTLLDHLIITNSGYLSFKDDGLM